MPTRVGSLRAGPGGHRRRMSRASTLSSMWPITESNVQHSGRAAQWVIILLLIGWAPGTAGTHGSRRTLTSLRLPHFGFISRKSTVRQPRGIGDGPSNYPLSQRCKTTMLGLALTATLALAGAAVSARTGPATSEPTVQIERMVGAMMFRRMRMTASMRYRGHLPRPWNRRPVRTSLFALPVL